MEIIKNPYAEMTEKELIDRIKPSWNGDGYLFRGLNFNNLWVGRTKEEAINVVLARYGKR